MNIEGLGPKVVEQLVQEGMLRSSADLYFLNRDELISLKRFGEKSADNLLNSIENSKRNDLSRLVYAFGIRHIGQQAARALAESFKTLSALREADESEISLVPILDLLWHIALFSGFQVISQPTSFPGWKRPESIWTILVPVLVESLKV